MQDVLPKSTPQTAPRVVSVILGATLLVCAAVAVVTLSGDSNAGTASTDAATATGATQLSGKAYDGSVFSCDAPNFVTKCVQSTSVNWFQKGWKGDKDKFQAVCRGNQGGSYPTDQFGGQGNLVRWGDPSMIQDCGVACAGCSWYRTCCYDPNPGNTLQTSYTVKTKWKTYKPSIHALMPQAPTDKCYIYTLGTSEDIDDATYPQYFMRDMAENGFCAATVQYPDDSVSKVPVVGKLEFWNFAVGDMAWKARVIYDANSPDSAIRRLEAASNGRCKCNNVVAHGFSQGAMIAAEAKLANPNVKGALLFSGGCQANWFDRCDSLTRAKLRWPKNNIREIASQQDGVLGCGLHNKLGGTLAWTDIGRSSLQQIKIVSGVNCDGGSCGNGKGQCPVQNCKDQCKCSNFKNNCFVNGGGGYYILKYAEYNRGHSWFLTGQEPDVIWPEALTTSKPFNIPRNLAWLRSTVHL